MSFWCRSRLIGIFFEETKAISEKKGLKGGVLEVQVEIWKFGPSDHRR